MLLNSSTPTASNCSYHNYIWNFISSLLLGRDVAVLLLGHDKWKEMMRSSLRGTPLMRKLITFMPGKLGLDTHPQCWWERWQWDIRPWKELRDLSPKPSDRVVHRRFQTRAYPGNARVKIRLILVITYKLWGSSCTVPGCMLALVSCPDGKLRKIGFSVVFRLGTRLC